AAARSTLAAAAADAQAAPLVLRAARAPQADELARCCAALAGALGLERLAQAPRVEVDADLIAGWELEGAGARVRNHLGADLARIGAELARDASAERAPSPEPAR
ncbi:MAG TPA: hypothetical protein VGC30_12570, partial [Dokdonella sp.]